MAKLVEGGRTRATVRMLEGEARVRELAAMMGGETPANLAGARELLARAPGAPEKISAI